MKRLRAFNKFYRRYEVDLWGRTGFQRFNKTVRFLKKVQKEKIRFSFNPGGSFKVAPVRPLPNSLRNFKISPYSLRYHFKSSKERKAKLDELTKQKEQREQAFLERLQRRTRENQEYKERLAKVRALPPAKNVDEFKYGYNERLELLKMQLKRQRETAATRDEKIRKKKELNNKLKKKIHGKKNLEKEKEKEIDTLERNDYKKKNRDREIEYKSKSERLREREINVKKKTIEEEKALGIFVTRKDKERNKNKKSFSVVNNTLKKNKKKEKGNKHIYNRKSNTSSANFANNKFKNKDKEKPDLKKTKEKEKGNINKRRRPSTFIYRIDYADPQRKRAKTSLSRELFLIKTKLLKFYNNIKKDQIRRYANTKTFKLKFKIARGYTNRALLKYNSTNSLQKRLALNAFFSLVEHRLDVLLFRSNLVSTLQQARQVINHRHVLVNENIVTHNGFMLKNFDVISLSKPVETLMRAQLFKNVKNKRITLYPPKYIYSDYRLMRASLVSNPLVTNIPFPFKIDLRKWLGLAKYMF